MIIFSRYNEYLKTGGIITANVTLNTYTDIVFRFELCVTALHHAVYTVDKKLDFSQ